MNRWKASPALRQLFIEEIFKAGYSSEEDRKHQPIRWTPEEMEQECDDKGILPLWLRYVTYWPDPENRKQRLELEFLASIEITQMLEE